jgi:hypothetical protein
MNDGPVKSPSAALRFTFVVAAHLGGALHSSVFARLASGAFYQTIVLVTFYEIIMDDCIEISRTCPCLFSKNSLQPQLETDTINL